jgi:hypothetical protein
MNNWTKLIALKDVHKNQPFRVVAGPSGHLTDDVWIKDEFVEKKDKYACYRYGVIEPWYTKPRFFSPRFKVYVQEV